MESTLAEAEQLRWGVQLAQEGVRLQEGAWGVGMLDVVLECMEKRFTFF